MHLPAPGGKLLFAGAGRKERGGVLKRRACPQIPRFGDKKKHCAGSLDIVLEAALRISYAASSLAEASTCGH
jgi:hypothetical protein